MRFGLVSDTHGRFDEGLATLFRGCARILHAGDVVRPVVLDCLEAIAPVTAVRGNNDVGADARGLREVETLDVGALRLLVIHELGKPEKLLPAARRAIARESPSSVGFGHSHHPNVRVENRVSGDPRDPRSTPACGLLLINPGSAGPRRFKLPRTAGLLEVRGRRATVTLSDLATDALGPFGLPGEAAL